MDTMPDADLITKFSADLDSFDSSMDSFLSDFNKFADNYRLKTKTKKRGDLGSFHNTFVPELTRAVESLATTHYRMMTAQDPNFFPLALHPRVSEQSLQAATTLLRYQMEHLEYNRKLLSALRSCALFGTVIIEEAFVPFPFGSPNTIAKGTDFIPRSLLQVAFESSCSDIEDADWIAITDWITVDKLKKFVKSDLSGTTWDKENIGKAIESNGNYRSLPRRVQERKIQAGYNVQDKNILEMVTFWRANPEAEDDLGDWVFRVINRQFMISKHPSPFKHGIRPFRVARYVDFELEPYGYGAGAFGDRALTDINYNRNRLMDLITFAVYSMFKSGTGGPKDKDLKIKPFNVIKMDDPNALQTLRPLIEAATYGIKLEEILKDDYRAETGATNTLQASPLDVTATEASIAQNEAIRRVGSYAEGIADRLIRRHIHVSHLNNIQFLDNQYWVRVTGQEKPVQVYPSLLSPDIDFIVRLTTDKDFKTNRVRRIIEALQVMATSKTTIQFTPQQIDPLVQELYRALGINPMLAPKMQTALQNMQSSQSVSQELLEEMPNTITSGQEPGIPEIQTPIGPVGVTP